MASTFKFELVSPEKLLMSADVEHVVVPGTMGDFGVLAGHAPFLSTVRPGILEILNGTKVEKRIYVSGGLADANAEGLTVLAQQAIDVKDFDKESLEQEIDKAQGELQEAKDDQAKMLVQAAIDQLEALRKDI